MNKTETMAILVPYLESIFVPLNYKYLKSREKFTCRCDIGNKWIITNVTFWPSKNFCMFSPVTGIHFDKLERFRSQYLGNKLDSHRPTLHILSDNNDGGGFCSFYSKEDIEDQKSGIKIKIEGIYLPYLDRLSNQDEIIPMVLNRSYDNFMNEYDRLIFLFSYVGAYNANNLVDSILKSFDPSRKKKNQQIPYHKQQLEMLKAGVPEIEMIGEL